VTTADASTWRVFRAEVDPALRLVVTPPAGSPSSAEDGLAYDLFGLGLRPH